jgi:hypothetical protein
MREHIDDFVKSQKLNKIVYTGESRHPGILNYYKTLDPGFHRGDDFYDFMLLIIS